MSQTLAIVDGDIYFNPQGQAELIQDRDKALQDLGEFLMTDQHSGLNGLIGRGAVSKSLVAMEVQTTVARLQTAQSRDPKCTAGERIAGIANLETAIVDRDVYFRVDVSTADRSTFTLEDGLRYRQHLPGAGYHTIDVQNTVQNVLP